MKRKILTFALSLIMMFSLIPTSLAADESFTINGTTVSQSSGTAVNNCSTYASQVLKRIWTVNAVMTTYNGSYNLLKGKNAEERKLTEAHVKTYIQSAPLGSRIRICASSDTTTNNYDNSMQGHTMVLVAKDDSAGTFTVLHAGWGSAATTVYTYSGFADHYIKQNGYYYFFYIADYSAAATNRKPDSGVSTGGGSNNPPKTYTVTLDANGGSVNPNTKSFPADSFIGELPEATRSGYTFLGWSNVKNASGMIFSPGSVRIEQDMTLYAVWKVNCTSHTYKAEVCTTCGSKLSYDNSFDSSVAGTYQVSVNNAYIRTGPYQEKDLVRTISKGETVQVTGSVINSYGNLWLKTSEGYYVHAEKMSLYTQKYTVSFVNGSTRISYTVTNGEVYSLPTPTKEGYTFDGWYTQPDGGYQITPSTIVNLTNDQTLYAHWTKVETGHWGPWSDWSTTPTTASSTRQVETQPGKKISDAHTEYRYGRYIDNTGRNICWCGKYLESLSYVTGSATLQYSSWTSSKFNPNGKAWTCGYCSGNHIGVDHYDSAGRPAWLQYVSPNGDSYYWEESRWVDATYETQYRYRDWIVD